MANPWEQFPIEKPKNNSEISPSEKDAVEQKDNQPEKLYRAFTIDPEVISLDKFRETLYPLNPNENDPTKISDGNELGVYMSTNQHMVEKAYASGGNSNPSVKCAKYNDGYSLVNYIKLPNCGAILEIDAKKLKIRKPQIDPALQGVYNNGFVGDEWIADEVAAGNYKVKKLILSRFANDSERFEVNIAAEKIEEAIELIKTEYGNRKELALRFKEFLESVPEQTRLNSFVLKRKWKEYLENDQKK